MLPNLDAEKLVALMQIDGHQGVYYIGCQARRITFLAQQNRALNLVWGLSKTKRLSKNMSCAIIGGGLAGMTAAAAALALGVEVRLFERRNCLMHLQKKNFQRYLHPNIADWPAKGSIQAATNLPLLNWKAAYADDVVGQIEKDYLLVKEKFSSNYTEKLNCELLDVLYFEGSSDPLVRYRDAKNNTQEQSFDVVLLAVGFGLESILEPIRFTSYWDNDNFIRPVLRDPIPRTFLVTGAGDGGLIDTIRLTLGVHHVEVIDKISGLEYRKNVDEERTPLNFSMLRQQLQLEYDLLEIEREAQHYLDKPSNKAKFDATVKIWKDDKRLSKMFEENDIERRVLQDLQANLIHHRYEELLQRFLEDGRYTPNLLGTWMKKLPDTIRSDIRVVLNDRAVAPTTLKSAIVNRFYVFMLMKCGKLRYKSGSAHVERSAAGTGRLTVRFEDIRSGHRSVEYFDEVILRHGPAPPLQEIFASRVNRLVTFNPESELKQEFEATSHRQYDEEFVLKIKKALGTLVREDRLSMKLRKIRREYEAILRQFIFLFDRSQIEFRCTVWRPSPDTDQTELWMVTDYFPRNFKGGPRRSLGKLDRGKGLVSRTFEQRKPSGIFYPEETTDVRYELSLIRNWGFNAMESTYIDKGKRGFAAYPFVSGQKCLSVFWCEFSKQDDCQNEIKRVMEICSNLESDVRKLEREFL